MDLINQDYIDNLVLWSADKETDLADIVNECIVNQDPAEEELMLKLMAVQFLSRSIRDYDITWEWFTEEEILLIEEQIMSIIQTCPNYG